MKNSIKSYFANRSNRHLAPVESYSSGRIFMLSAGTSLLVTPFYINTIFGYTSLPAIILEFVMFITSFFLFFLPLAGIYKPDFIAGLTIYLLSFSIEVLSFYFVPGSSLLFLEIILLCIAVTLALIISQYKGYAERIHLRSFIIGAVITSLIILFIMLMNSVPFPTDESVLDYYSAKYFLHGINPYIKGTLYGLLPKMGFTFDRTTPLTIGGFVQSLGYPDLAFISYIPAVLFHIKEAFVQIPLYIIPFLLVSYNFRKKGYSNYIPFAALAIFSAMPFFYEGLTTGNSVFWVSLIMASYIFEDRSAISGIMLGLSSSFKQFPLIVLPFLIIYMLKRKTKKGLSIWFTSFVGSFILINAYFIFLNPMAFFTSLISPEMSSLIGVGSGISQLSFAGFLPISREFFFLIMLYLIIFFVAAYLIYFNRLKYCLFIIPVIIFIFNYRLFVQYVMFWPLISLLVIPGIMREHDIRDTTNGIKRSITGKVSGLSPTRAARNIAIISIIFLIVPTAAFLEVSHVNSYFSINSVHTNSVPELNTSVVYEMSVNLTYHGSGNDSIPVFFRIMPYGPMTNINNMIWHSTNRSQIIGIDQTQTFLIVPYNSTQFLRTGEEFRLIVYFGNIIGEKTVS
ncbi:hypothetical protein OXIME_000635 [Oxyplasma meridianum]|uniref:DUF2029 domain-containing protein n=1 Tax=Oxyplasma meridianum TaxID=3073602 RepID=A0AAX4NH26_9ARCH